MFVERDPRRYRLPPIVRTPHHLEDDDRRREPAGRVDDQGENGARPAAAPGTAQRPNPPHQQRGDRHDRFQIADCEREAIAERNERAVERGEDPVRICVFDPVARPRRKDGDGRQRQSGGVEHEGALHGKRYVANVPTRVKPTRS